MFETAYSSTCEHPEVSEARRFVQQRTATHCIPMALTFPGAGKPRQLLLQAAAGIYGYGLYVP